MKKLSNERLNELNEIRVAQCLKNIISLLDVSELEAYKVNIAEAKERVQNSMNGYSEDSFSYQNFVNRLESLEVLEKELMERIQLEQAVTVEEVVEVTEQVEVKTSNSKIERTGVEMLTTDEYLELKRKHMPRAKVVSFFYTTTDKNRDVVVKLRSDGSIIYVYLKDGNETLKYYHINTPDFKYVCDEDKSYKKKLPNWITAEELKELY